MRRDSRAALCLLAATVLVAARPLAPGGTERLAALVTTGMPRGLVTVVVPVPEEFRGADEVTFEVRASGEMEVLGRRSGYAVTRGAPAKPLVLTLRVPAGADAGVLAAADVHFRSRDRELIVPVVVRVALVRSISLHGARELRGLRVGDRLTLAYRVVNAGNATDTIVVDTHGPMGWTVRLARPARIVVPARGAIDVGATVVIPGSANVGDHPLSVSVRAINTTDVLSVVHTTLGIAGRSGRTAGVVLKPSVAMASTGGASVLSTGAVLEGPVALDTYLRAQLAPAVAAGGALTQGLSSVGAYATPISATLNGPYWDLAAGNVGLQLADLTGVNVMGQGATARVKRGGTEARAIAARPGAGRGMQGALAGAGYWRETTLGRVGGSVSYLSEQRGYATDRELTAAGLDYSTHALGTVVVSTSVAHRSTSTVSGAGLGATVAHERDGERAVLRATHAPGGTAAFARATDEVQLDYARTISDRWSADVSAMRSDDAGPVFSRMRVTSLSMGHRYLLNEATQVMLRAHGSAFDANTAEGSIGGFGADDRAIAAGGEWRRGTFSVTAEGSYGIVSRSNERFDGGTFTSAAAQRTARVGVSRAFDRWGALDAGASVELTDAGVGIPGEMVSATARWSSVPVNLLGRQARVNTEATYQRLGALQSSLVARSSATIALPGGLDLAMSVERNPFFRDAAGRASWIGAMRLSAATRVYATDALGPEGVVFEDRNRNGKHDEGEPGVGGVIVRRGESRARTNRDGTYRLAAHARGIARLDQASLPLGLISHPLLASDSIERLDLPVLPTATALLDLELVADDGGRLPQVDLEPGIVMLRDATGFEWVGRRTSATRAEFGGIPIGTYTVVFNGARVREPLRADEQVIELRAGETRIAPVRLRSRAVRVFTPNQRSR